MASDCSLNCDWSFWCAKLRGCFGNWRFCVLDLQLHELNDRFDEDNIELLQCVSCLSPSSSFEAFDVKKLLRMIELYPNDFVDVPEVVVRHQLHNYVRNV